MKKLILLVLVGSLLLISMSSCLPNDKNEGTTPDNTTENNALPTPSAKNPFGDKAVSLTTDLLIQSPFLSAGFALDIRNTENGEIYLNDILYENIGSLSNLEITYEETMINYGVETNEEMSNVLAKIKNAPNCYVLETQSKDHFAKKISVYYIDGVYYLLDTYGGTVTRIWHSNKSPIETPEGTTPEGATPEGTTPENTPQETTPPENSTTENTPPQNNNLPAPNENGLFSDRSGTVVMEVLAQIPVSSYYGVEVEMADDGKIYINDILYENIGVFATPELAYLEPIPYMAQQDEELAEILQKIQSTQSCYVLETQGVERYGKKISVYYIDDTYYFLNKYDGNVSRIWYENKTIEPTPENPPVNNIVPAPDGEKPFGTVQTSFTAEIFAQNTLMSSRFSLEVRIDNDKIYLGKTLYSCFGIFKNPTVTYSEYLLQDIEFDEDAGEKMKVLEKIKNSETCYMLKPVESDSEKTIMLYYIDGVYYFSDSVDGKPSRIHYAITDTPQ